MDENTTAVIVMGIGMMAICFILWLASKRDL